MVATNEIGIRTAPTPFWLEGRVIGEALSLVFSPTTYGLGAPNGNGGPVLLIPGFLADDLSMHPLWWSLTVRGWRPYFSELGRNDYCLNDQLDRLSRRLDQIRSLTKHQNQPVDVIGWSLGGLLARALKKTRPDGVGKVITLATPQQIDAGIHPWLAQLAALNSQRVQRQTGKIACFTAECSCVFAQTVRDENEADVCIWSESDGIVEGKGTKHFDETRNRHIPTSHIGMGLSPRVHREVANILAGFGRERLSVEP